MQSRAEALYAQAANMQAEIVDLAEGLRCVADVTYGNGEPSRNYRREIGMREMMANSQVEQLRDIAQEMARVWDRRAEAPRGSM